MTDKTDKVHLGDGVYAECDGFRVTLTTENGVSITNTIILEAPIYRTLAQWLESLRVREELEAANDR